MPAADFAQISFWWLPRVNPNGGDDAGFGDYAPVPAGGVYYYTDLRVLLPSGGGQGDYYRPWWLPQWWPRKTYLTGIHMEFGASGPAQQVNLTCYIDVKGIGYKTGTPPGAEIGSDFTRDIKIHGEVWICDPDKSVNYGMQRPLFFDHPIPFNRDQGDHLVLSTAHNLALDWVSVTPFFLITAPYSTGPLGSAY